MWASIICAALALASSAVSELPSSSLAQSASRDVQSVPSSAKSSLQSDVARAALDRGLAFLAQQQALEPSGAFPASGATLAAPVATTALGALAYMAGGNSAERGPQGRELALAIDYLIARTELDPKAEHTGYIAQQGDSQSRMHGHGFAALALAQAYAMSPKSARGARIERALESAIARIEQSQGVEGGWYYEPVKGLQHEGSITVCMLQALRAAHNAGLHVEKQTIARAVDYLERSQKDNGSFRYAIGQEDSTVALTAAAIASLNATGTYGGKRVEEGYAFLFRELAVRDSIGGYALEPQRIEKGVASGALVNPPLCPFYERLYLAQALWQNADHRVYQDWSRKETPRVLATQAADGSWHDPKYGDCYATAMNCLFLALPEGLLPIFQR